jgi:hypothetical protein
MTPICATPICQGCGAIHGPPLTNVAIPIGEQFQGNVILSDRVNSLSIRV